MRPALWGLMFVAVVLLSNPGVDVSPLHTPMLALGMGGLALIVSCLTAIFKGTTPVRPL